jgi:hypothetical protein
MKLKDFLKQFEGKDLESNIYKSDISFADPSEPSDDEYEQIYGKGFDDGYKENKRNNPYLMNDKRFEIYEIGNKKGLNKYYVETVG